MSDAASSSHAPVTDAAPFRLGLRLSHKIALAFVGLLALVLTAFWLTVRHELAFELQDQADSLGNALVGLTADSVTELVLANDLLSLNVVLNQLAATEHVASVVVFNVDNQVIASAGSLQRPEAGLINTAYTAQIALQDSIAGTVRLTLDASQLSSRAESSARAYWVFLALGALFAAVSAFALGNHIAAPLLGMARALVSGRPEDLPADTGRNDEVGLLRQGLAELLTSEAEEEAEEAALLLPGIRTDVAATPAGGMRLQASVLAIRVVNANQAAELLQPATLGRLLAEFGHFAQQAARLYGGQLLRFDGDAALLGFDARASTDHAFNAVCCAQLFLLLARELARRHRAAGSPALEFRLGINSGNAFLAPVPARGVRGEILVGKTVETAERLAALPRAGQLCIGAATLAQAGADRLASASPREVQAEAGAMQAPPPAWFLDSGMGQYGALLERQMRHLLPAEGETGDPQPSETNPI